MRIRASKNTSERSKIYAIALPCVDCNSNACIEECPVDCIYQGERMLYIHPGECVGCGACEPVCPVEAIYHADNMPLLWRDFLRINAEFFDELGSPGGASKAGRIGTDHPLVAALPSQDDDPPESELPPQGGDH